MPLFDIKKKEEKKEKDSKNIYTSIFEKKEEKKEKESDVIAGVFAKKEKEEKPKEKILGPLPELERKIVGAFDPSKRNLKILRSLFVGTIVLALLAVGFFYAELNPKFDLLANLRGPNTAQKLANSETEVVTTQTTINQKNYLLASYYLNELSYSSDSYARDRRDNLPQDELSTIQNNILLAYDNAQTKWSEPIAVGDIPKTTYENQLKKEFQQELNQLKKETPSATINSEIKDYTAALQLVGNNKLNSFFGVNTDDIRTDLPRDDSKLFTLTQDVLSILKNDFSNISSFKASRVQWSLIVQEIEKVTKSVDNLYNTGFFDELGGVQYSNYDFDASSNRIILSGRAKRDDGSTFTLIANLIDALENSTMFSDVDNRSYPKSGSEEAGYISTFRIELELAEDYF